MYFEICSFYKDDVQHAQWGGTPCSSDSDEEFITKRADRGIFQLKFSELRG